MDTATKRNELIHLAFAAFWEETLRSKYLWFVKVFGPDVGKAWLCNEDTTLFI
jgi:hypothetical protein